MSDPLDFEAARSQQKAKSVFENAKSLLSIKTPEKIAEETFLSGATGLSRDVVGQLSPQEIAPLTKLPRFEKISIDVRNDPQWIDALDNTGVMEEAPDKYEHALTIWNLAKRVRQTYDETIGAGLADKAIGEEQSIMGREILQARLRGEEPSADLLERYQDVKRRAQEIGSPDFTDVTQWPRIITTGMAQSADMWLVDKETTDAFSRWYFGEAEFAGQNLGDLFAESNLANRLGTLGQVALTAGSGKAGIYAGRVNTFYEAFQLEKGSMAFAMADLYGEDGKPVDPEVLDTFSTLYGAGAALVELGSQFFELPQIQRAVKAAKGVIFRKTVEALNKPTVRSSLVGAGKDILIGSIQEGTEEGIQFVKLKIAEEWAKIFSRNFKESASFDDAINNIFTEENFNELIASVATGAIGGGGQSSVLQTVRLPAELASAAQHEQREAAFTALAKGVQESDLTGQSGEAVAALVTEAGLQTKVDKIYIEADKIEEALNQNKLAADDVVAGLGAEIAAAKAQQRPVEIDSGTFAVRVAGSTFFSEVRDHIKFAADSLSRSERAEEIARLEKVAAETIENLDKSEKVVFETSSNKLRQEFAKQIYETGRYTKSEASRNALIFEGIYRSIAAALTRSEGKLVTPQEAFREHEKLRIVGPGVDVQLKGPKVESLAQNAIVRVTDTETGETRNFEAPTEQEARDQIRNAGVRDDDPRFLVEAIEAQPTEGKRRPPQERLAPEPQPEAVAPLAVEPDETLDIEGKAQIFAAPAGVEERIRRKTGRKREGRKYRSGKGEPTNKRTRLTLADGSVVSVGKIRPQDWVERIKSIGLTDEEIRDFRNWYREVNGVFLEIFGPDAPIFAASWLMAQQNTSPIEALRNALRVREQILNGTIGDPKLKKGGVAHDRLVQFWSEALKAKQTKKLSALAGAQKLYDFVDSALLKKRRTWMGNREEGQQPAVIDVHTARDSGFLDETFRDRLIELGASAKKLDAIEIDMKGAPTEAQYERAAEWLHEVFDYLNETGEFGGGFEYVSEVQALGWMALLVQTKQPASAARDAIAARMFRMSSEAVFGEGAPLAARFPELASDTSLSLEDRLDVTSSVVQTAFMQAAKIMGDPPVVSSATGMGGWNRFTNASTQIEILATDEAAGDMAAAVGYLLQQTEVWSGRELRPTISGNMPSGVTDWFVDIDAPELADRANLSVLWDAVLRESGSELGFSPTATGIRLYISHRDQGGKVLPWGTKKVAKAEEALRAAVIEPILRAAESVPFAVDVSATLGAVIKARNDWKESPDGQGYLSRFEDRPGLADQLRAARGSVEASIARELDATVRIESFSQPVDGRGDRGAAEGSEEHAENHRRLGLLGDDGEPIALSELHQGTKNSESAQRAVYRAIGMNVEAGANTSSTLKIYPLTPVFGETVEEVEAKLRPWLEREGWNYQIFGPKNGDRPAVYPNFADPNTPTYDSDPKTVWIFDPSLEEGSFRDHAYTLAWRVTHEVAHGIVNQKLTDKYGGRGRRAGAMGVEIKGPYFKGGAPLTLADAMRAVEWEHETFIEQRRILREVFGVEITDEQFNLENSVNMADAVYRSITGQFGNPGEIGVYPTNVDPQQVLSKAFDVLRTISDEINGDQHEVLQARSNEEVKGEYARTSTQSFIRMTEAADLSTLLHEGAHFYLSTLSKLVRDGKADELVMRDVEAILRYLEVDSIEQLTQPYADGRQWQGRVDIPHERFARSFEAYLAEGRAPSEGMRKAFRAFQAWMISVYGTLKEIARTLGVQLDDEIRGVFDRMIALDDVLDQSEQGPVFSSKEESTLSDTQWSSLLDAFAGAREETQAKVVAPFVRRVTAERKQQRRELFDALYDQYAEQVDQEPIYRAIEILRNGDPEGVIQGRLNRDQIVALYARPEMAARVLAGVPRGTVARGGELDLQFAAEYWGFKTGSQFLDALIKAAPREEEIRRRVNEDIASRPEFTPETIEQDARSLLGGEELAKAFALQLTALRDLAKGKLLEASRRAVAEVGAGPASASAARVQAAKEALKRAQESQNQEEVAKAQLELVASEAAAKAELEGRRAQEAGKRRVREIESALNQQAIRQKAVEIVVNRPSGTIKADRRVWARELEKAQRAARKAVAGRDYQTAVRQLERASLLNWMIVEGDDAIRRQPGILENARKFDKRSVRDKLRTAGATSELDLIDVLLEKYDLRRDVPVDPSLVGAERVREIARRREKAREERQQREAAWRGAYPSFAAWAAQRKAELEVVDVDESLFVRPERKHWKELTVGELDGLDASLRNMEKLAKNEVSSAKAKLKAGYSDMADRIVAAMLKKNLNRTSRDRAEDETFRGALRRGIDTVDALHIRMARLFRWMAGDDIDENPLLQIEERWGEATDREATWNFDMNRKYQELIEKLYSNGKDYRTKISVPELPRLRTRGQIVAFALNLGTVSNLNKLKKGFNLDDAQVDRVIGMLDDSEWEFVQSVWDLVNSLWSEMSDNHYRMTGVRVRKIEAREFLAPTGRVMKGGYYPVAYDPTASGVIDRIKDRQALQSMFEHYASAPTTSHGFTEDRNENFAAPILLDLDVVQSHVSSVIHDVVWREVLRDSWKILHQPQLKSAIIEMYGKEYFDAIQHRIRMLAGATPSPLLNLRWLQNAIQKVIGAQTAYALAGAFSTTFTQFSSFTNAIPRISPDNLVEGSGLMMKSLWLMATRWKEMRAFIFENSTRMRFRASTMDASIREENEKLAGRTDRIARARRFGFMFIAVADGYIAGATWLARYEKVMSETMNKDRAIAEANIVVERTQGAGNVKDLAQIQDADPLLKPLVMFYSYFSALYNEMHATLEDVADGKIKRAAAAYILISVIPSMLADLIKLNIPDPDSDEPEKEWAKWLAYEFLMAPISSVVLVRDMANAAVNVAAGRAFGGYDLTPATAFIDQFIRTVDTLGGAIFDEDDDLSLPEFLQEMTATGGQILGLPFARQLNIIASNFAKAEETGVEIGLSDFLVRRRSQ